MEGPRVLRIVELQSEPGLVHGFSTLALGSVGLMHASDPDGAHASRGAFAKELGLDAGSLTAAGAVHGARAARVDEPHDVVRGADALVTNRQGVALFATYADCYPIVLWDPTRRAAALVHAGWRGTIAGVTRAAVDAMRVEYRSDPDDIHAGIGPGICASCYEVGDEVATRFDPRFVTDSAGGRFLLDLAAANRDQLVGEGVRHVYRLHLCTKETDYLPSHRRAPDGERFGAIVALA